MPIQSISILIVTAIICIRIDKFCGSTRCYLLCCNLNVVLVSNLFSVAEKSALPCEYVWVRLSPRESMWVRVRARSLSNSLKNVVYLRCFDAERWPYRLHISFFHSCWLIRHLFKAHLLNLNSDCCCLYTYRGCVARAELPAFWVTWGGTLPCRLLWLIHVSH